MTSIGSSSTFRDEWIAGAARAFFVSAYADYCEDPDFCDDESDDDDDDRDELPRPGPREDWCDYAPTTPPNAYALAGELWAMLESKNGASVYALADRAKEADGEDPDPEDFGHDLAMQAMGHGVSWFDSHKAFPIEIPHMEVSSCSFSRDAYRGE
jgi:hypothetical protein